MSPFMHAHKINEPILLIHGMADNNSGTFPIQSERLFAALKGFGGRRVSSTCRTRATAIRPRVRPRRAGRDVRMVRQVREEQKVNNGFPQTL